MKPLLRELCGNKMSDKLTGMKWLNEHIKQLEITTNQFNEITREVAKINPKIYNKFQAWTPLKLVLLNYALDVCTLIISSNIKNNKIFEKSYYIDLFAGSGLNKINNDYLIGSPLISSLKYSNRFDSLFFCENNLQLYNSLKKRLDFINKNNVFSEYGDCNKCLSDIIKKINYPKSYSFFFIDPHCMEFSWQSMTEVLKLRSDVVFTLMTSEIFRSIRLCNSGKSNGDYLTSFFGDESWREIDNYDTLVEKYKSNILKLRQNAIIEDIVVKSKKFNFCYHMIFITNQTKNGCPWTRAIKKAKEEIESNSDKSVELALEIVKKRQKTLF